MSDERLNAYLDGELDEASRAEIERRLETDAALRERLAELREIDATLRAAYAEASAPTDLSSSRRRSIPWMLAPLAAAAGLVAGLFLGGEPADPGFFAFPTVATGPVRVSSDGGPSREVKAGDLLQEGSVVTTPPTVRAALVLRDGTEVRLDRGASVRLEGARRLDLLAGRLWARVAPGDPFVCAAGEASVTALGTEFAVQREASRTEIQLFSGRLAVSAAGVTHDLAAGESTVFENGALAEARRIEAEAIATGWMLELYAYSGRHERDLAAHLDALLAEMGRRKALLVEERTLVTELSGVCRVPLARYLESESASGETDSRRKAARVLARIADESLAPVLARALRDPDFEVRVSAAEGLRRLSGGAVCAEPETFRAACDDLAADAAAHWAEKR